MTSVELLKWAVPFALGLIVKHLYDKARNRLSILRWQAQTQAVAQSGRGTEFSLKVLFNEAECRKIFLTQVTIVNESGSDLGDLEISFRFTNDATILHQNAAIKRAPWVLPLAPDFQKKIEIVQKLIKDSESRELTEQEIQFELDVYRHRDYAVSALNRGGIIDAYFLVDSSLESGIPIVEVMTTTKGVKAVEKKYVRPPAPEIWRVPTLYAAYAGLPLVIIAVAALYQYVTIDWLVVSIATLLGIFTALLGAAAIRVGQFLISIFR